MAEDSAGYDNEALIAGLENGDIKPQFYEGGFKTWECALDLARLVTGETGEENSGEQEEDTHFIEVCLSGFFLLNLIWYIWIEADHIHDV